MGTPAGPTVCPSIATLSAARWHQGIFESSSRHDNRRRDGDAISRNFWCVARLVTADTSWICRGCITQTLARSRERDKPCVGRASRPWICCMRVWEGNDAIACLMVSQHMGPRRSTLWRRRAAAQCAGCPLPYFLTPSTDISSSPLYTSPESCLSNPAPSTHATPTLHGGRPRSSTRRRARSPTRTGAPS